MSSFFSSDGSFPLQFAIIFVVIFLVLAAGVFLVRRLGGKDSPLSGKNSPRGRQPRLGIVDIYELDRQRQLILLRRDNVEHLLLVGGPNDVVIERNILRGMSARLATEEPTFDEAPEPVLNTMPEAPVPQQAPVPSLAPMAQPVAPYREPSFEMPAPVPAADQVIVPPAPERMRAPVPEPVPGGPPAAAPRPRDSQLARVIRRTPPSLTNLVPAAIAERVGLPERGTDSEADRDTPAPVPAAPIVPAPAARAIDAAILSDMARQLEEALRRPSAAVRPAIPAQAAASEPAPSDSVPAAAELSEGSEPEVRSEPPRAPLGASSAIDPIAAAMAATAQAPAVEDRGISEPEPATVDDALFTERAEDEEPVAVPPETPTPAVAESRSDPVTHEAVADAPKSEGHAPAETSPAVITPPPAPAPAAPAKPPASPNPFSVEEIEAEFARLLGRPLDRKQ